MRTITPGIFALVFMQNLVAYLLPIAFLSAPVAVIVGMKSFEFLGFVVMFGLPAFLLYWMTKSALNKVQFVWDTSRKKLFESLKKIDYWNVDSGGGLGVDVAAKQISFVDASDYKNIQAPFVFNVDRVQNIRWVKPGHVEFYNTGGISTDYMTTLHNQREKEKAALQTGLFLHVNDLHHPILFFRTDYADAERLGFLIGKFMDGTLEPTAEPMFYPALSK